MRDIGDLVDADTLEAALEKHRSMRGSPARRRCSPRSWAARHAGISRAPWRRIAPTGATIEERRASIGKAILRKVLVADMVGLVRAAVAEARRFPDLAASVRRMAQERGSEAVAHLLGELAESDKLPALAADLRAATARHFLDLILLPVLMRALFGKRLTALRAEIAPHVARTVAFFLANRRQSPLGGQNAQHRVVASGSSFSVIRSFRGEDRSHPCRVNSTNRSLR
jgi:hypothetical protein